MTVTDGTDLALANLSGDGQLSLREAVEAINTGSAVDGIGPTSGVFGTDDQIVFDSSLTGSTIVLTAGELALTRSATITGLGQDDLTISGNNASRIFNFSDPSDGDFTIAGLTLTGGQATDNIPGGAIRSRASGNLAVHQSTVSGNSSVSSGGGIHAKWRRHARREYCQWQ